MKEEVKCGECGAPMRLLESRKFGKFYGCTKWPECNGTHGAHQKTGEPLGIPANVETKKMRILAHEAFDTLWINNKGSRKEAYKWMQKTLLLSKEDAHISKFDIATCERLINAIEDKAVREDERGKCLAVFKNHVCEDDRFGCNCIGWIEQAIREGK